MIHDIEIYLPFPPTVNSYYGTTRSGVKYITKKGREFREKVSEELHQQVLSAPGAGHFPLTDPLYVECTLHMPDKRRRDLDNYMKALLDACTISKLWEDDSIIDQLHIYRGTITKGGLVKLSISEGGPIMPLEKKGD